MIQAAEIEAAYQRGFELRCNGRYREAKLELQRVLAMDPTHCDARWQIGLIKGFEGDFDGSLADLEALSKLFPSNVRVRNDLAMTQMMLGYSDEACANFREILRLEPNHENAKKQMAYCE